MRLRYHQPPAVRSNPLDERGDVAGLVLAVLNCALFVPENQASKQHLPQFIVWKDDTYKPLRTAQLAKILHLGALPDSAGERPVSDIIEQSRAPGAELNNPAAIHAVGNGSTDRRVRVEQLTFASNLRRMAGLAGGIERFDE